MKKLLAILSSIGLVATSSSAVVSCSLFSQSTKNADPSKDDSSKSNNNGGGSSDANKDHSSGSKSDDNKYPKYPTLSPSPTFISYDEKTKYATFGIDLQMGKSVALNDLPKCISVFEANTGKLISTTFRLEDKRISYLEADNSYGIYFDFPATKDKEYSLYEVNNNHPAWKISSSFQIENH